MKPITTPRPIHQTTRINTRRVPVAVHDQFKAYCARRSYTMQAAIIALMKMAARDDMRLPEARKK